MRLLGSWVPSLALLAISSLGVACEGEHQYLVVYGAEAKDFIAGVDARTSSQLAPGSVSVLDGALALSTGKSVRVRVDFGTAATFPVSQLWLWVMNPRGKVADTLELPITPQEAAAGSAEFVISAVDQRPGKDTCAPAAGSSGTCYTEVDDGVASVFAIPASPTAAGFPGTKVAATLSSASSGSGACAGFTAAKCCAGQPGISAVSCNVDRACGCPQGTTYAGEKADGTVTCMCP